MPSGLLDYLDYRVVIHFELQTVQLNSLLFGSGPTAIPAHDFLRVHEV